MKGSPEYEEIPNSNRPRNTSLHRTLTVKQFNYRVKGSEKFWTEEGAEGMLQLRADQLSDGCPQAAFWQRREAQEFGQNRYRIAV